MNENFIDVVITKHRCIFCNGMYNTVHHICRYNPEHHSCFSCLNILGITETDGDEQKAGQCIKMIICALGKEISVKELSDNSWKLEKDCLNYECIQDYSGKDSYEEHVLHMLSMFERYKATDEN